MQTRISELITQQNWQTLVEGIGLEYIDLDIGKEDFSLWNIDENFCGDLRLLGKKKRVCFFSIQMDNYDENRCLQAIRDCARKTTDTLLWLVDHKSPKIVYYDAVLRKAKSLSVDYLDAKELDFDQSPDQSLTAIFDTSAITKRFFLAFRKQHHALSNAIENGPHDAPTRHVIALIWMLRITFLTFAQSQGALNGDYNYLSKAVKRYTTSELHSFHLEFLNVIFFDLLNTPIHERKEDAKVLGQIPFLNGGLFEASLEEKKWTKMKVCNATWSQVFSQLFEKFRFVSENKAMSDTSGVDPEMLGKVFEALMAAGDRKRTGAFYTPTTIVQKMVIEGVYGYLSDRVDISTSALDGCLQSHAKRGEIIRHLNQLRILDPAVGTGAFLIEALHLILDLRNRLGLQQKGTKIEDLIHRHLFGVDKNPTAVRLCELRFWLQILSSYKGPIKDLPPLPNLSHRFVPGDSLLDPFETLSASVQKKRWSSIAKLQSEFTRSHGGPKRALLHKIESEKRALQVAEISMRRKKCIEERTLIERALSGRDLLGEPVKASPLQSDLLRKNAATEKELLALENRVLENTQAPIFSYHSHFPDVMRRGGFDLIIMNPPWVRQHNLPENERKQFSTRYKSNSSQLWKDARTQNIRSRYGSQGDLSSMFLERACELCRPGGRVVALVPSKLLRGISAAPIRGLLGERDLRSVFDLSESEENLFDATTYPAMISLRNQKAEGQIEIGSSQRRGEQRDRNSLLLFGNDRRAPWTCAPQEVSQIIRKISARHSSLGRFEKLEPRRGIYTGANDIFVKNKGEFPASFSPFLKTLIEGKGRKRELLYLYDKRSRIMPEICPQIESYFEAHRSRLISRADYKNSKPMWQIYRNHPDLVGPKIIWRDISKWFDVSLETSDALPLNTVYLIPCSDEKLAERLITYFRSDFVQVFMRLLGERVRGGYRRHFAWTVQCIPLPSAIFEDSKSSDYLEISTKEKTILRRFIENEKN